MSAQNTLIVSQVPVKDTMVLLVLLHYHLNTNDTTK